MAGLGVVVFVAALILALLNLARANAERDRAQVEEVMAQLDSIKSITLRSLLVPMAGETRDGAGGYALVRDAPGSEGEIRAQSMAIDLLSERVGDVLNGQLCTGRPLLGGTLAECYQNLGMNEAAGRQLEMKTGLLRAVHGPDEVRVADSLVDYATSGAEDSG